MKNLIKRYELPSFFLLSYVLSWLSVPFLQGGITPQGVAIAARIIIGITLGAQGVREYQKRLTNWRAGWWYLIAPMIVIGYEGIALGLNLTAGAKLVELPHLSMGTFIMLVLFGGQWEEMGWTAYALPKLRERFANHSNSSLIAVLVLGVFRMLWHLPLFLYGKMYWFDIFVFTFSFQIIVAWLYDHSGKSVPAVMTFHFMSNIMGAAMSSVFLGADQIAYQTLFMLLAMLFAIILILSSHYKVRQQELATD